MRVVARNVLKTATGNSLVLIDELGKGTEALDGTAVLASIVLELQERKCLGIFATCAWPPVLRMHVICKTHGLEPPASAAGATHAPPVTALQNVRSPTFCRAAHAADACASACSLKTNCGLACMSRQMAIPHHGHDCQVYAQT